MGEGFQFFDIILLAMLAAFIGLRLRSVLGRRPGHERRPPPGTVKAYVGQDGTVVALLQQAAAALALDADGAAAQIALGRVHLQLQEHEKARAILEPLVERRPDDDYARFLLAAAYRALGQPEQAARHLPSGPPPEPVRSDPWPA